MKQLDSKTPSIYGLSTKLLGRMLAVSALLLGISALPAAADDNGCSNATLKGDYAYAVTATSLTIPPVGPLAILGKITLDGKGSFTGSVNGVIGGIVILTDVPITGTYSIASDCTGTLMTIYPAFTAHFSLVIVEGAEGRSEAETIGTDPGTVGTATIKPVKIGCDHDHD